LWIVFSVAESAALTEYVQALSQLLGGAMNV